MYLAPDQQWDKMQDPLAVFYIQIQSPCLDKLDVCLLSVEHVLAGEPGPVLIQVGQHLSLQKEHELENTIPR